MATFSGINKEGKEYSFEAASSEQALANADLRADSGVQQLGAISSQSLSPQPSFQVATVPPSTGGAGMQGEIESSVDTFTKDLEAQAKQAEKSEKSSFEDLVNTALNTPGETELTAKAEQKAGVDTLDVELKGINDQIRKEQNALRRQIEAVQTTPGLTKGQVDQEVSEINRVSLRKQADLYVIQQGVQGRYDSAKAIADRAVAVQMEQSQRKLQLLQLNYERNKDLFTKSEQRLFETRQADRERKLQKEERNLQEISDLSLNALKNGANPTLAAQMRQAKTVEEAFQIGGQYIDRYARMAQEASIANIYDQMRARKQALVKEGATAQEKKQVETEAALRNLGFINTLKTHPGFKSSVGAAFGKATRGLFDSIPFVKVNTKGAVPGTDKANFISAHDQFVNSLTLENLDLMKGVLSETDIKILSSAATRLTLGMSEKEYTKEIDLIKSTFQRALSNNGVTDEQAEFYFGLDPSDISDVDSLYGIPQSSQSFSPANYY